MNTQGMYDNDKNHTEKLQQNQDKSKIKCT